MDTAELISNPKVKGVFDSYPKHVQSQMLYLRTLVLETASEIDGLEKLEETLKWGEPSYISKIGTTIRYDWKSKYPDEYRIYFHCQTTLIETFKEVYGGTFIYEGNRALIFKVGEQVPVKELSHCLSMALRYKKVKHLDFLGA